MSPDVDRDTWADLLTPIEAYLRPGVGVVAIDREGGGRVLIIDETDERAADRYIEALNRTVAEENPEYPENDRVFVAVYLEALPELTETISPYMVARDCRRRDIAKYEFPESRLKPIAPDRITMADFDSRGGEDE